MMMTTTDELKASGEAIDSRYRKLARNVGIQWPRLARALNLNPEHVRKIQMEIDSSNAETQSTAMMATWLASTSLQGQQLDETLLKALDDIGRSELNQHLLEERNIFEERSGEVDSHDVSAFHALEAELGTSPDPRSAQHVSSPFPALSPSADHNETLRINTNDLNATKAEEDNHALNSARDSVYEEDYDSDKPHFIYVRENDATVEDENDGKSSSNRDDGKRREDDELSVSSSNASVCSEVNNYRQQDADADRSTPQPPSTAPQEGSDHHDDDDDDDDEEEFEDAVEETKESEGSESSISSAEVVENGGRNEYDDSSEDEAPPVRSFTFTVQE